MDEGEAVLDDVREAYLEWTAAEAAFNEAVSKLNAAETALYSTLNADSAAVEIIAPGIEELRAETGRLRASLDTGSLSTEGCWELVSAGIETESAEAELGSTWAFEPDLSLGGRLTASQGNLPALSATLSLSAGPSNFNITEREELEQQLDLCREKEARVESEQRMLLRSALLSAETAKLNVAGAETEKEQAEELLGEAALLAELGEYSEAELEETKLLFESAVNSLFEAAAAEYTALRNLQPWSVPEKCS